MVSRIKVKGLWFNSFLLRRIRGEFGIVGNGFFMESSRGGGGGIVVLSDVRKVLCWDFVGVYGISG